MTQGGQKARKHRRRRSDGASSKTAVAAQTQAGAPDAILSCPFCGFLSAECGSLLKHVEDAHPEDDRPPQCGSGSNSRLGSSGPRSSHDGSRGNGKANDVHLKSRKKMAASSTSRPAAAIAAGAATGVATTSVVINGSPDDSDSMSDNDEGKANGESQFADCPVDGCQESVVASEMAYHVDLHAALEYQGKPVDDSDVVSKGKDNAKSLAAAPKKANDSRTRAQALSFDGRAQGMSAARSSSVPPVQRRPQRSASRKSTDSSKSVNAVKLSGARESRKVSVSAPPPRDDSRERHRERREHQRNQERGRGRGRVHTGELGLSTLGQNSSSHQTFLSRKPSKTIRSWLAMFSGVDSRKHAPSEEPERARGDRDKEKDKAIIPLVHRHRHSSSAKNGAAKAMEAVSETPKRLGKAELGKFADEDRMPDALAVYLKKEWGVRHEGMIPVLQALLEQNPTTEYAYLCDPCVQHVSRLPKEGGFCGYRNIQTMTSYIVGTEFPGHQAFSKDLPSVFDLQDLIENAWDQGINSRGRIETGGIRLTRKYIGTPEAVALFQSLNIPCSINAFKHKTPEKSRDSLLRDVENYFSKGYYQPGHKVRATTLPPIYWQHPGHSLTIVGIEKTTTGETNLLVFDPIFRNGSAMVRFVNRQQRLPDQLLRPYRRGARYLSRYRAFEILKLQPMAKDYDYGLPVSKSPAAPSTP